MDVLIEAMSVVCHRKALKWKDESTVICSNNRNIKLKPLRDPSEPLKRLLNDTDCRTKLFMNSIRNYNNAIIIMRLVQQTFLLKYYMPTFKV